MPVLAIKRFVYKRFNGMIVVVFNGKGTANIGMMASRSDVEDDIVRARCKDRCDYRDVWKMRTTGYRMVGYQYIPVSQLSLPVFVLITDGELHASQVNRDYRTIS